MIENEVLEAIQNYANASGLEVTPPEDCIIEMKLPYKTDQRFFVRYEHNKAGSAWITFTLLVGQILDPKACIDLFFMGRWKTTNFYFRGHKMGELCYFDAETIVHLHENLTIKQASDMLWRMARLPMFEPSWPQGLDIFSKELES